MLDGEYEWLSAVVDNLADDNTKLVYADWLQEHGDDDRAKFLRQLVVAGKSMAPDQFPNIPAGVPFGWVELVGYRLLGVLATTGHADLKKPWLKLARPALRVHRLEPEGKPVHVGGTKIGGRPDLPFGVEWPRGKECAATYNDDTAGVEAYAGFLAQINFAQLADTQAAKGLPARGLLLFFAYQDDNNPDVIGARAIFVPNPTGLGRTKPPGKLTAANAELPEQLLRLEETLDIPESDGPWGKELRPDEDTDYDGAYNQLRRVNFDNMLGYGRATSGDDPTPDKKHRHLIMLNNAGGCRLHIQIHEKDLKALNFDKIKLVWVDFD